MLGRSCLSGLTGARRGGSGLDARLEAERDDIDDEVGERRVVGVRADDALHVLLARASASVGLGTVDALALRDGRDAALMTAHEEHVQRGGRIGEHDIPPRREVRAVE
jgi:hypothetical protein